MLGKNTGIAKAKKDKPVMSFGGDNMSTSGYSICGFLVSEFGDPHDDEDIVLGLDYGK